MYIVVIVKESIVSFWVVNFSDECRNSSKEKLWEVVCVWWWFGFVILCYVERVLFCILYVSDLRIMIMYYCDSFLIFGR